MRPRQRKAARGQRDMSLSVDERRFEVGTPDHGVRLDAFLGERLSWRSREQVQTAIVDGAVEILPFKDRQEAEIGRMRPSLRLRLGQEVIVRLPSARAEAGPGLPPAAPARVIHEDADLLVVDKPPERNVYPSRRHRGNSLIEWVHARHRRLHSESGYFPTPCHRLDRETSGVVLFAKSREVRSELSRRFEERTVRKLYLAVVEGCPATEGGLIDGALGPDPTSSVEMKVAVSSQGQPARTKWRLLRAFGEHSLLELEPRSGRRHQLRVHLASMGHPIVGDKLYGGGDELFLRSLADELTREDLALLGLTRQALHAWKLEFELDCRGTDYRFEAPLPPDMANWIEKLENPEAACSRYAVGV